MRDNAQKLAEHYEKKYRTQIQALEKSPLAKAKGLTEYDISAFGKQLDAFRKMVKIEEDNGTVANLGPLPKIGLDVITASFGVSPLPVICGIQPIDDVIGLVWFKDVIAKSTRGNVTTDDTLISPLAMPDVFPQDFASDTKVSRTVISASNGAQTYNDVALGGTEDFQSPINPETITITGSAIFNSGADTATFPEMIVNPETGEFSSAVKVNGTMYTVFGTVDFDAGTFDLEFSADPSGQTTFTSTFQVLQEAMDDLQSQLLVMQAKTVRARFFALKGTYGFAQSYMMQTRWGMSAEGEMTRDLTAAVNNEVFNIVLAKVIANIPSNAIVDWGRQPQSGVSYYEHIMTLPSALTDASALLTKNLGRGQVQAYIAGLKAAAILEQHPNFSVTFSDDTVGPHVFGTFNGKPVVRVPAAAQLDENRIIGLWKGSNPFEAAVVWAPYMPLTMTEVTGTGPNPLQRMRAAATWGAVDTMIPNALCAVDIDQTSFDYGSI